MRIMLAQHAEAAYHQSIPEVLTSLKTDARLGLSAEEVRARLDTYGKNELTSEKPVPWWPKSLRQFQDMLVVLLLVATAISTAVWFYERDSTLPYEAVAIFVILLLNAVMGYVQASRAEQAIASFRAMSPAEASVIRAQSTCSSDGRLAEIRCVYFTIENAKIDRSSASTSSVKAA